MGTDPPPLTWRIALTTLYALTCYTVITAELSGRVLLFSAHCILLAVNE